MLDAGSKQLPELLARFALALRMYSLPWQSSLAPLELPWSGREFSYEGHQSHTNMDFLTTFTCSSSPLFMTFKLHLYSSALTWPLFQKIICGHGGQAG